MHLLDVEFHWPGCKVTYSFILNFQGQRTLLQHALGTIWVPGCLAPFLSHLGLDGFPPIGFELVKFSKLHADILNGELQEVPESGQVLESGHGESIGVLPGRRRKEWKETELVSKAPSC